MERRVSRATLIATLTAPPSPMMDGIPEGLEAAEWLEVRADLAGDLDPGPLRKAFPGRPLLYTLRSRAEGGAMEGSAERRKRRLLDAARRYDYVDLEMARDLAPEVLKGIPPERRVISWHGPRLRSPACRRRSARWPTSRPPSTSWCPRPPSRARSCRRCSC
ncbi:MAG: type I 3-dehydroquinate dehydratase [Thermoanaerobaculia bacterium]